MSEGPVPRLGVPGGTRKRRKTFLLGLGCQKGGTTWLYRYLAGSPQFAKGYLKEYHVFDALDLESERWMRDRILRRAATELEKAQRGEQVHAGLLHRASMYADPEFYFDYFTGLLRTRKRYALTADMTPDYAMLSPERVASIKESFSRRGVRTASIFLMRDPVERIWSQTRMRVQRQPHRFESTAEEVVASTFAEPINELRTRYDRTLRMIDAVHEPGDVWCGFYESLFQESQIEEICHMLGIGFRDPNFDRRRNAYSKQGAELPVDVVRAVANHYAGVYEEVARRFPDVDLERIWPSSRFVR